MPDVVNHTDDVIAAKEPSNNALQFMTDINTSSSSKIILAVCFLLVACAPDGYKHFSNNVPENVPKIFGGDRFAKNSFVQFISFTEDGKELFVSVSNPNWKYLAILKSTLKDQQWSALDTFSVMAKEINVGEPFVHGNKIYFVAFNQNQIRRQTEIYFAVQKKGKETEARKLPEHINSPDNEWHPTFTKSGTMYFASERTNDRFQADIYKSEFINSSFTNPVKLSDSINSKYNDGDPLIAPDESFLIFHSERPGGSGGHDLYVSFKRKDGSWTSAKNMGSTINSSELEFGPSLSPDGRYLFFTRRKAFQTETASVIYWVSAKMIDGLR